MKRYAPFVIVALVALATITSGVFLYRHEQPADLKQSAITDGPELKGTHVLGNVSAKVTLEEYGDFQCPPCGALSEPLNGFVQEFQPNLRFIYRNFPLPMHRHAREAALAAEAAGLQGKFWEMHDLLYREQGVWSKAANVQFLFSNYANMLGLDAHRFALDSASETAKDLVEKDEKRGKSLNVKNTPTLFINGTAVEAKDLAPPTLHSLIDAALNKNPKS
jgi:protein-disulfide isomerase